MGQERLGLTLENFQIFKDWMGLELDGEDVGLGRLAAIADAHAFEVRGKDVARGEPFPVADELGDRRVVLVRLNLKAQTAGG